MDIRQLRFFVSVAHHRNFTEAAKELYIAQPVVSQQIADLERQVGTKLLSRTKRTVQLTPAGEFFLDGTKLLLNQLDELCYQTCAIASSLQGNLSIGYLGLIEKRLLPFGVRRFSLHYPAIKTEVSQYEWNELISTLDRGYINLAFLPLLGIPNKGDIAWRKICTDKLCLFTSRNHPAANSTKVDLASFSKEPFVTFSKRTARVAYDQLFKLCEARGFIPRIARQARSIDTLLLLVEAGVGSLISSSRLTELYPTYKLSCLEIEGDDTTFDNVVAWKKSHNNPAITLFLKDFGTLEHSDLL